jgi:hypothetical protein
LANSSASVFQESKVSPEVFKLFSSVLKSG